MIGALLAVAIAGQPVPAGWFEPGMEDVHFQTIKKSEGEKDWPFVASSGKLLCVSMVPGPVVAFIADGSAEKDRPLLLDANPYNMMIQNWGLKNVLLPYDKPEELIKRIAPFVAMGHMLCKQKNGPGVPGGEL
jgi:hypothetical protein